MRVLLASASSGSRGGGEFFLVYLGEALRELDVEVGLWVSADSRMDGVASLFSASGPVFREEYTNTYLRPTRSFSHIMPLGDRLRPILDQWQSFSPDILHLNKQCLEDGLDLLALASRWHIPQGCTIHITQTAVVLKAFLASFRDRVARRALRRYPGALWAVSAHRSEELRAFVGGPSPIPYVSNGVRIPTIDHVREERNRMSEHFFGDRRPRGPIAVCVGRLEEQKDPLRFLEILREWKCVEPGLTGIWVGDGRFRASFDERVRSMEAAEWIHCTGWRADPSPFLCMADVYVHPARFEGLPFALLEAMAHGKPCVLSPSLAYELKDIPRDAWIIADEASSRWLPRLQDKAELDRLGNRARQLAQERFSIQAMARAYLNLYENLGTQGRRLSA